MEVEIPTEGALLRGQLIRPDGPIRAVAVLHGATGVPARFYGEFARWLADNGVACLTYDYRDFGWSGSPRGSPATMTDWGVRDQQAARNYAAEAMPGTPVWVIGHSLGGMMLSYQTGLDRIDRVICVAAGAVHVTDHPWPYQAFARAFWTPGLPSLARRVGYLPMQAIGVGPDIPAGVYEQWRRWCLSRDFQASDPDLVATRPEALACPVRMVAVADDSLCPPKSVWRLMKAYPAARISKEVIRPKDVGLARIGHLDVLGSKGAGAWNSVLGDVLTDECV